MLFRRELRANPQKWFSGTKMKSLNGLFIRRFDYIQTSKSQIMKELPFLCLKLVLKFFIKIFQVLM